MWLTRLNKGILRWKNSKTVIDVSCVISEESLMTNLVGIFLFCVILWATFKAIGVLIEVFNNWIGAGKNIFLNKISEVVVKWENEFNHSYKILLQKWRWAMGNNDSLKLTDIAFTWFSFESAPNFRVQS